MALADYINPMKKLSSAGNQAPAGIARPTSSAGSFQRVGGMGGIATVSNYEPNSNPYNTGPLAPATKPGPAYSPRFDPASPQFESAPGVQNEAPAGPRQGGREWYNSLDAGGQAAQDNQWLGGDSDYAAQMGEYDKALSSFVDRIAKQKGLFEQDGADATASVNKNQDMTLNNLGEDFGARGLSYSGLFDQTKNQNIGRFNETRTGIVKNTDRNKVDADNRQKDYETENRISRSNATRSALMRMAQQQTILDSGA